MPDRQKLRPVKPGDPITAEMWNQLLDLVLRNNLTLGSGSGLAMIETPGGKALRLARVREAYVGKTNGAISARSGTTPGTGTVTIQALNSSGALVSSGIDVTAKNYSGATGGIATGKYCFIEQTSSGKWWIVSVEC